MGSNHSDSEGETFRRQDWAIVQRSEMSSTWQNLRDPTQRIQQFQEYKHERQMYYMRKNHPQVVAALYLSSQSNHDFCSSTYQQKLFIQTIPIRLADIEHIPFPDYLHIYSQALKGYSYLSTYIGYFPVQQDYIGINQKSVVKVWMNPDLSKSQVVGHRVTQEVMVRTIVEIIDKNIDRSQVSIPSVKDYIYRNNDKVTFEQAISELNHFTQQYNGGNTPSRLECIDKVGGIYMIAHRDRSIHQQVKNQHQQVVVQSKPRLVDSQILNNYQYPIHHFENNSNKIPTIQSSQIVPNSQNHILTPSTVRQNIPIVRRQPFLLNNINPRLQSNFIPNQIFPLQSNNIYRPQQRYENLPKSNLVFNQQPYSQPQPLPQPIVYIDRNNPFITPNSQMKIPQNIPNQIYSQNISPNINQSYNKPSPTINNSDQIANNLHNMIFNEKLPTIDNNVPQITFPQFRPPIISNNQPNTNIGNTFNKLFIPQSAPLQNNFEFRPKPTESIHNVNIDDGKSPSDFFNRLNSFNSMQGQKGLKYHPQSTQALNKTINLAAYQYKNPFTEASQNTQKIQQNFGKSAVSNIVQGGYESNYSYDKIKQPLKFQNNLDMNYSVFQTEQAQFQPSYSYNKYQTHYDPELLQDINRLKQ